MLANGPEALHRDPGSLEIQSDEAARDINGGGQPEPGRTDLIERDATNGRRKAGRPVRKRVRGFIEELIREELDAALSRPRYGRPAKDGASEFWSFVGDRSNESRCRNFFRSF